jgi:hypothetical protein
MIVGANTIDVLVTAQSGLTKTYTVTIRRLNDFDLLGLGTVLNPVPAYSLRRLCSGYAGKAINVRRSSDNATIDIGFGDANELDTVGLKNFTGTGSAYVTRWYDQSGNGFDAVQANTATQPRMVNSGVVERSMEDLLSGLEQLASLPQSSRCIQPLHQ